MIAFGPIPSRRLGRSLGINHIPPKTCSYSCVYCQLGRTDKMRAERQAFYEPQEIVQAVREKVEKTRAAGEAIDYLTFVPDGEPTLDVNLGREIELLRPLGIKIAVISNSSLIWREDVRADLGKADWVSLNVDSVQEEVWHQIDRPHGSLALDAILDGMLTFADEYDGVLTTETMLIDGPEMRKADGAENVRAIADFLARLEPDKAYLAIPTRPPAEPWVRPADEQAINRAYQVLSEKAPHVEYLIGYEGNEFAFTGDVEDDLLSITAVHPMREDAVEDFLARAGADWDPVQKLIEQEQLIRIEHDGQTFYMRKLR
jgi:wyosine [tRNA(Phe)-imidazoG37] synthetase (radical SAM superfamily)